jgi:zinc D-Ala-D-Ala carboxypeptidase
MPTPISKLWTLEDATRTSHLDIPNQIEQVLRYGRIHSPEQIRKDIERTARTLADPLCERFGKGTASSWYRCLALNRAVGGAANSAHTVGLALDWQPTVSIAVAITWALAQPSEQLPFDRLIVEERGKTRWLHVQAAEEDATPSRAIYHSPVSGLFVKVTHDQVLALNL